MNNLRPHQITIPIQAVEILRQYHIVYFAMHVRTGKTITALETAKLYGAKKVLFLTKKKAIASIEKDYCAFGYTFALKVTNYEQLGKFVFDFDFIVCDEAHCLQGYPKPGLRVKLLKKLITNQPIVYLSGTPTPESYSQIFHQLAITRHSIYNRYYNFYAWARDYVEVTQDRRGAYMVNNYSNANGERIKKDIAPIVITYTQDEAGFKCDVNENFLEVIDDKIVYLIKKLFKNRILTFCAGKCVADTPASVMGKMHQISGGTAICENYTAIFSDSKIKFIKEYFTGKKIAIYYKFQAEKELIKMYYPNATEIPEEFQDGKSDTFISQIVSGREGITLWKADAIVFYAIDYSAVSYWQARARLQDLKRETPAEIYWIFTRGGIEKKVYEAVSNKKDFTYSYFRRNVII